MKTITINLSDGEVVVVEGLPPGYEYETVTLDAVEVA